MPGGHGGPFEVRFAIGASHDFNGAMPGGHGGPFFGPPSQGIARTLQWGHARRAWRAQRDLVIGLCVADFNGAMPGGHGGLSFTGRCVWFTTYFNGAMPGGHGGLRFLDY